MTTKVLDAAPNLGVLYAKAAVTALGRGGGLPDEHLARNGVTADPAHLAEYARVCHLPLGDVLPATYPHMLTFPLQMQLMTGRSFPLALPGLVHVRNRIEVLRAIRSDEPLDMEDPLDLYAYRLLDSGVALAIAREHREQRSLWQLIAQIDDR